jgi:hypothetical protein
VSLITPLITNARNGHLVPALLHPPGASTLTDQHLHRPRHLPGAGRDPRRRRLPGPRAAAGPGLCGIVLGTCRALTCLALRHLRLEGTDHLDCLICPDGRSLKPL